MTDDRGTEIVPVHPEKVPLVWDTVLPWIERALEHGSGLYTPMDIFEAIQRTEFLLWVAIRDKKVIGMTVTSIDVYPRKKVATIRWGGGETHEGRDWLLPMVDELKRWGKHFGAEVLGGSGRRGWLRGFGFREAGCLFEQDID